MMERGWSVLGLPQQPAEAVDRRDAHQRLERLRLLERGERVVAALEKAEAFQGLDNRLAVADRRRPPRVDDRQHHRRRLVPAALAADAIASRACAPASSFHNGLEGRQWRRPRLSPRARFAARQPRLTLIISPTRDCEHVRRTALALAEHRVAFSISNNGVWPG